METKIETLSILRDFHKITGARISIHDIDYNEIAAYPNKLNPFCEAVQKNANGKKMCLGKDAEAFRIVRETEKPYTYTCHCGLTETVAPIFHYGVLSGYFMMGQIFVPDRTEADSIKLLSSSFFENTKEIDSNLEKIPRIDTIAHSSFINILNIIAEYMTHTNRVIPKRRELAENVKEYIIKNYNKNISIDALCQTFECSRTTLMKSFKTKYGMTLGEYLTRYRLSKAEHMLRTTSSSIKQISLDCGFSDQNYFSKVFLKRYSFTPTAYRKRFL